VAYAAILEVGILTWYGMLYAGMLLALHTVMGIQWLDAVSRQHTATVAHCEAASWGTASYGTLDQPGAVATLPGHPRLVVCS